MFRAVEEAETRVTTQRRARSNRLAFVLGAVGCFVVCWIASRILGAAGAPDKVGEMAGGAIGGMFGMLSEDFDLPGLRRGEFYGWLAYYASVFIPLAYR